MFQGTPAVKRVAIPQTPVIGIQQTPYYTPAAAIQPYLQPIPQQSSHLAHPISSYLLKGDSLAISSTGQIPDDVLNSIKSVPLDSITAAIEKRNAFVALAIPDRCFVFGWRQKAPSKVDTLPLQAYAGTRFVTLIPSEARMGLLVASDSGVLRMWDNIAFSQEFLEAQIPLSTDEVGTCMSQCEPAGFVFGTNKGLLYKISLIRAAGTAPTLITRAFTRPVAWFDKAARMFAAGVAHYGGKPSSEPVPATAADAFSKGIVSIAPVVRTDARQTRDVYVLTKTNLEKWSVAKEARDEMISDQEFLRLVTACIARDGDVMDSDVSTELHDMECLKDGDFVILVSARVQNGPLSPLLIVASVSEDGSIYVKDVKNLFGAPTGPYSSPPRLAVSNGGPGVFAVFHNAIVATVIHKNGFFQELVKLRDPNVDRLLAVGMDLPSLSSNLRDTEPVSNIVCLCAQSSILSVEMFTSKIVARQSGSVASEMPEVDQSLMTKRLRSEIEQALFFGADNDASNLISYVDFNETQGSVEQAALDISNSILDGSCTYIPSVLTELRTQLVERLHRIQKLIDIIHAKSGLHQISQHGRYLLCFNAEKITVSVHLYNFQNNLAETSSSQVPSLLTQAMERVIKLRPRHEETDYRRAFYRYEIGNIAQLLYQIHNLIVPDPGDGVNPQQIANVLEANNVIHLLLSNAHAYRQAHAQLYDLDLSRPPLESWTATNDIQGTLQAQFETTKSIILMLDRSGIPLQMPNIATPPSPETSPVARLKRQVVKLADLIYSATRSQLLYLRSKQNASRDDTSRMDRVSEIHLGVIYALFDVGCDDDAYRLSEKYEDVQTLADLCVRRPDAQNRIPFYIDKFGEVFTRVLYRLYLVEGLWKQLLNQDQRYDEYVTKFLNRENVPWFSWIQDVRTRSYAEAGYKLESAAATETSLSKKSLALSMSFLALVSNMPTSDKEVVTVNSRISEVEVLLKLNALSAALANSLEAGIPQQTQAHLNRLSQERPAMVSLYRTIVDRVVTDGQISFDDCVDILTLTPDGDFVTAMEVALEMFAVPSLRSDTLIKTIWRRAWLNDRWALFVKSLETPGAGHSDADMTRQLRGSHAYQVLTCIRSRGDGFASCIKPPSQVLYEMGEGNIQSRTVRLSHEEQSQLVLDYESENKALYDLLDNHRLRQVFDEMSKMAL
ncbi:hypothetical protein SmJEL517_g00412 [Synchytrium microbalum]|uniref:Nucleoporin Nup133/Nup155-like C-terminal domain-containing protein n=1 Tax=Synchytrium microbalum TaxID=1806994 RepID=A0A507CK76_9FUNG|nr:uncharacterized protein SmJEL517_g00412 [Synchytrium microbalum]TPX38213.1 hypothetical protein SmJEL517_g00412 [Synchytrium microbalum]